MNSFLYKLLKIRSGFFKSIQLLLILDLITFFSVFYAIFTIFNVQYLLNKSSLYLPIHIEIIPSILAFVMAIIGALVLHRKDSKVNITLLIEDRYPELKERLRTAYDNKDETNIIVESLKIYVSEALNKVSSSQLLAKNKIQTKILVTIILIVGAATIALNPGTYSIPSDTWNNIWNNISNNILDNTRNETRPSEVVDRSEDFDKMGINDEGDIIGKPKIAPIEGKPVDLFLEMGIQVGDIPKDYSATTNQFIRSAVFPVDVLGSSVSDGGYGILMKKTEAERQLINKYAIGRSKI